MDRLCNGCAAGHHDWCRLAGCPCKDGEHPNRGILQLPDVLHPYSGETYVHERDYGRMNRQLRRVFEIVRDGEWHTLANIARVTGDPEASISARLRDLRNKYGLTVERRYVSRGLHAYRVMERPGKGVADAIRDTS